MFASRALGVGCAHECLLLDQLVRGCLGTKKSGGTSLALRVLNRIPDSLCPLALRACGVRVALISLGTRRRCWWFVIPGAARLTQGLTVGATCDYRVCASQTPRVGYALISLGTRCRYSWFVISRSARLTYGMTAAVAWHFGKCSRCTLHVRLTYIHFEQLPFAANYEPKRYMSAWLCVDGVNRVWGVTRWKSKKAKLG